jgi:hypothetical protein
MRLRLLTLVAFLFVCLPAFAQRQRAYLWCEQGGQTITVNGIQSSQKVQRSWVTSAGTGCTVDVYDTGTTNHTNLCVDAACVTPLANPFTATSTGLIAFYAQTEPATVDVQASGSGVASPYLVSSGLQLCGLSSCAAGGTGTVTTVTRTNNAGNVALLTITNPTTTPNINITTNLTFAGSTTVVANAATSGFTDNNSPVCRDSSGNLYTNGCSSATNALVTNPSATQTAQGTAPTVVSLQSECPAGAASTLDCFAIKDNTGTNVFETQQSGLSIGSGYMRTLGFQNSLVTVSFSATPTFNLALGHTFAITLTSNVTSSTLFGTVPSNYSQPVTFIIIQDGSGGHSFAWPSNVIGGKVIDTHAPASTRVIQTFHYDGTNFVYDASPTSNGLVLEAGGTNAPSGTVNTSTCPTGDPLLGWTQRSTNNWQTQASIDETTLHGSTIGRVNLGCWGLDFNDSGARPIAGNNNFINVYHVWGNGGVQPAGTNGAALSVFTINSGAQQDFSGAGQLVNIYAENRMIGSGLLIPSGPEPAISVIRGTLSDERTNTTGLSGGSGGIFAISTNYEIHTAASYTSCGGGGCAGSYQSLVQAGATPVATGNHGSDIVSGFFSKRDFGAATATNLAWAGFLVAATGTRFPTNYGVYISNLGTNAADFNFVSVGVNSAGTAAGFNALGGPTSLGLGVAQAASGFQLDVLGAVKLKAAAAANNICYFGSTSGSACWQAAAAQGTPNAMSPPTATGSSNALLMTDGANPQQLSWTLTPSLTSLSLTGQFTSTLATGTAPLVIASTTTVPNLTVSNHPKTFACGTTTTCSATAQTSAIIVQGRVTLSGGTATVTALPTFTSTSSFHCTAQDTTSTATSANAVPASTTSITVTGTLTDVIDYICVGN